METMLKVAGGIAISGTVLFMGACTYVLVRMMNNPEDRAKYIEAMEKNDKKR